MGLGEKPAAPLAVRAAGFPHTCAVAESGRCERRGTDDLRKVEETGRFSGVLGVFRSSLHELYDQAATSHAELALSRGRVDTRARAPPAPVPLNISLAPSPHSRSVPFAPVAQSVRADTRCYLCPWAPTLSRWPAASPPRPRPRPATSPPSAPSPHASKGSPFSSSGTWDADWSHHTKQRCDLLRKTPLLGSPRRGAARRAVSGSRPCLSLCGSPPSSSPVSNVCQASPSAVALRLRPQSPGPARSCLLASPVLLVPPLLKRRSRASSRHPDPSCPLRRALNLAAHQ